MKFGLRRKYTLLLAGLTLAASFIIGSIFFYQIHLTMQKITVTRLGIIRQAKTAEINKRGHDMVGLLSAALTAPLKSGHPREIENVAERAIRLHNLSTIAIYDTKARLIRGYNKKAADLHYPTEADIRDKILGQGQWLVTSNDTNAIYTAPIISDGQTLGAISITVGDSLTDSSVHMMHEMLDELLKKARASFIAAGIIMLTLFLISSVLIGAFAARRLSKPIEALAKAAQRIGEGNYDFTLPMEHQDEIGQLAAALLRMTNDLKKTTVSMKYLDNIIGNMNEGLIVTGSSGHIDKINQAACHLLGYTEEELIGRPAETIIALPPPAEEMNIDKAVTETARMNSTITTKEGRILTIRLSQTVLNSLGGELPGTVYVFNDITEIKQREAELKAARDEAMIANRSKSQFLATMSHELRTPLNAIIGFSSMLKDQIGGPLSEKYQSYAIDIYESADHLLMIINDLLDISKLEAGKMRLMEEPVELSETVYASIRLIGEKARAKGITIKTIGIDDVPAIFADKRMIKQMVTNLLSNAYKFNQEGGSIIIKASHDPGAGLDISVSDTGIGIASDDLARITLPFSQVESHISRNYQGTGLGLAITKSMMELHGGALVIESEKGRGTKVTLHFPSSCIEV